MYCLLVYNTTWTTKASQLLLLCESFYIWTVLFLKLSVGLFYLRLSVERWQKGIVWSLMVLSTTFSIALFFMIVFQCGVPDNMVIFVVKKATKQCLSSKVVESVTYTHAAITAFTDWVFVILPFFILRKSNMQGREKIVVGVLMAFASIGGVAALVRFKYVPGIAQPQETFFTSVTDIAIWSCVEPGIGIAAGSFICLRPLFKKPIEAASRAFGYMSSYSQGKKRSGYANELYSTSTSNLRDPIDWQKQYSRDMENSYEMQNQQANNWPISGQFVPKAVVMQSEKQFHTVLDTRHVPRRSDTGLPLAVYNSNRPTPTTTRDAWIDDSDSR
jgi:hypothetical protein